MRYALLSMTLAALSLGGCSDDAGSGGPVHSTLKNDNYPGVTAQFQSGFAIGEGAAAIFAPHAGDYTVEQVQLLFGGGGTTQTITLSIYTDSGTVAPGLPIFTADYEITPSDNAYQVIDLTADSVSVPSGKGLRVAIFFQHAGVPGVAADSGGIGVHRNAIYAGSAWSFAEDEAITGDWIIRALIATH